MDTMAKSLLEEIRSFPVIDAHEHLPEEDTLGARDLFSSGMLSYFITDLIGAGMTWSQYNDVVNFDIPVEDRWKILEPYWENARYTGYGMCTERSLAELYGVDRLDASTVVEAQKRYCEANNKSGHYYHVLHEVGGIEVSVNDMINDMKFCVDPLFRFVGRIDDLVEEKDPEKLLEFGNRQGVKIDCLADYELACEKYIDSLIEQGHIGLKCTLAYRRPLLFKEVPRQKAEELFRRLMGNEFAQEHREDHLELQDYLMHFVLGLANERKMFLQLHTGIQAGCGMVTDTNPMLLNNLFLKYPDLRFDLFHIGYPYQTQIGAVVKMFPNVFVNLCWANIISPVASVRALEEWLTLMPVNKITGFGGDSLAVDVVLGHLRMAQENIAKALSFHVNDGTFSRKEALRIGKRLLYDNPKELYKL